MAFTAVHDGTGFCSADGIHVDPVLTPKGERTDGALTELSLYQNNSVNVPFEDSALEKRTGRWSIP